MSEFYIQNGELYHFGVKGMKWGRRKADYKSKSIRSALAKRSNDKVDKSFKAWTENAKIRDDAINLGKKMNIAKIAYANDKSNKSLKAEYKQSNKLYKKALSKNTTYRKGVVRQEVGRDAARKYLSEAKKVKKALINDPANKALQNKYSDLMSKHDVERAKARKATNVSSKRMHKKAGIKRTMNMTVKAVAVTASAAAGAYAVNRYLNNHDVTLNGNSIRVTTDGIKGMADAVKKGREFIGYFY